MKQEQRYNSSSMEIKQEQVYNSPIIEINRRKDIIGVQRYNKSVEIKHDQSIIGEEKKEKFTYNKSKEICSC